MTCPILQAVVSMIEKSGWVEILEAKLQSNPEYVAMMEQSHKRYIDERWNLLTPEDKEYLEKMNW